MSLLVYAYTPHQLHLATAWPLATIGPRTALPAAHFSGRRRIPIMLGGPYARQTLALVRRGLLVKLHGWKGSLLELLLPIGFGCLLILLKSVATVYESPNVAYSCGPARPFDDRVPDPAGFPGAASLAWLGCYVPPQELQPPGDTCTAPEGENGNSYYQNTISLLNINIASSLGCES